MVNDLIIIGAAGSGREVAEAIEDINSLGRKWNLLGFLDDDPYKQGREYNGYPVLGPISTATTYSTSQFVVVIGNDRDLMLTKRMVDGLAFDSRQFATIVHPSASVSRYADIAPGTVILNNCLITANVTIGKHVLIMFGTTIAHDCTIGDYVIIAPNAVVSGGVSIRDGCYIGANTTIIQKVEIGPWARAGVGAAIYSDVPPHTTVVGNPGRLVKR